VKQEPGLRAEHQAAFAPAAPRVTEPGRKNLEEILAFYKPRPDSLCIAVPPGKRLWRYGWSGAARMQTTAPFPPPMRWHCLPFRTGETIPQSVTPTRPAGSSAWPRSQPTWPRAMASPGTPRPTTGRARPGCLAAHSAHRLPGREDHGSQGSHPERRGPGMAAWAAAAGRGQSAKRLMCPVDSPR
jgi:hypothetical protein